MKSFKFLILFSAMLLPLQVFSQNPIYVAGGSIFVVYEPAQQRKQISFSLTGESFFSATTTQGSASNFVTPIIRYPKALSDVTNQDTVGIDHRGDTSYNGSSAFNVYYFNQNAAQNTNFDFKLKYAVPKFGPKDNEVLIYVPFTMTGKILTFISNTQPNSSLHTFTVYGSGYAILKFTRVRDFSGRHLRKIYLVSADYRILNQPFPG